MTTNISPALNRYFTAIPAEIAQNKYTQQTSKERYAYISMVAFVALAAIANYFLNPLVLPITLIYVNFGVLSLASNLVIPRVMQWFAEAKKLKAQGDKETKIDEKYQEIGRLNSSQLSALYGMHSLPSRHLRGPLTLATELPVVARALYWHDQSEGLFLKAQTLKDESKCRESLETRLLGLKAKLKAAYYAALISHPNHPGKFKDAIAFRDANVEQWAYQRSCRHDDAEVIAHTKETQPAPIQEAWIRNETIGELAERMIPEHNTSETSESSDSESNSDSDTIS